MLLTNSIVPVTDFRKHPFMKEGDQIMAVMKNNKPEYYTITPEKLSTLLESEQRLIDAEALIEAIKQGRLIAEDL